MIGTAAKPHCWAIVLAGGEGTRIRPLIERWLGTPRPKQYCSFFGDESMLELTLNRALRLVEPQRVVTVTGPGHQRHLEDLDIDSLPGLVLEQPRNLDTGPGVFLPVAHVIDRDPEAVVVVMPSDHFVVPTDGMIEQLERTVELAGALPLRIVLLGAIPDRAEPDYGWIEPGDRTIEIQRARMVRAFYEKPSRARAREYRNRGFLWNTMIVVCKARTLWRLGRQVLPRMMEHFDRYRRVLARHPAGDGSNRDERVALERVYASVDPSNFSRDVLAKVVDRTLVIPMEGVHWNDWGRPERIHESLAAIGEEPNFVSVVADVATSAPQPAPRG